MVFKNKFIAVVPYVLLPGLFVCIEFLKLSEMSEQLGRKLKASFRALGLWCVKNQSAADIIQRLADADDMVIKKTYSNRFDTHAPFRIDGNFGSAAGVMEMLMQSQTGDIYILPALPTVWDSGEIKGIKAKNGAEVDIDWTDGKATEFTITLAVSGDLTVGYDKADTTYGSRFGASCSEISIL